jgi:hypothetical protein
VIQIVEVTKGAGAAARLGAKLKQEHRRNAEDYIEQFALHGRLEFPIVWRFVVRQKDIHSLKSHPDFVAFTESGGVATVESLGGCVRHAQKHDALMRKNESNKVRPLGPPL